MITMHHLLSTIFLILFIEKIHSQVAFESLCSPEVEVTGLSSIDGNDEFEIDLYEAKFLSEDTILCKNLLKIFENKFRFVFFSGNKTKTKKLWY